jgi:hypothetical protein
MNDLAHQFYAIFEEQKWIDLGNAYTAILIEESDHCCVLKQLI